VNSITHNRSFLVLLALALVVSLGSAVSNGRSMEREHAKNPSLTSLMYGVGPTTASLLAGHGLTTCNEDMGTIGNPICFHSGRMPVATLVVASGIRLLGDHYFRVGVFKTLLLLIPLVMAMYLVCLRLPENSPWRYLAILALLIYPFFNTQFLSDVVNLPVEEDYLYSFLALALAVVLFPAPKGSWLRSHPIAEGLLAGFAVGSLYLSKSSMILAAAVLLLAYVFRTRESAARVIAVCLALCFPLGWAAYQHHSSGRYTLGTSYDGINFHKGNNPIFVSIYPIPPDITLDSYDPQLNVGKWFPDEWAFNDYHQHEAIAFIKAHPRQILRVDENKLAIIFFSLKKQGATRSHGMALRLEQVGMLLFRLTFWASILLSVVALFLRWPALRWDGLCFLALVAAVALPYVVGFPFTRHFAVLIYPSVLFCCRAIEVWPKRALAEA